MLKGFVIKKILELVMKKMLEKYKLDKIQDYVEKPNELDIKVKKLEKKYKSDKEKLDKKLEKVLKLLKK